MKIPQRSPSCRSGSSTETNNTDRRRINMVGDVSALEATRLTIEHKGRDGKYASMACKSSARSNLATLKRLLIPVISLCVIAANLASASPTPGQTTGSTSSELGGKILLRIILLNTREEAEMVLGKLQGGQSFGDLAKIYSVDAPTKLAGGLVGSISPGDLRREYQIALSRIGPGGTTAIIDLPSGNFALLHWDDPRATGTSPNPENRVAKVSESAGKARQPLPRSTTKSGQPILLSSKELMIGDAHGQKFSGTIAVTGDVNDCRLVTYEVNDVRVSPADGEGSAHMSAATFETFSPGVTLVFRAHSCIAASGTSSGIKYHLDLKGEPGAAMGIDDGQTVTDGPLIVSGTETAAPPFATSLVDVDPSSSDPLVFELTTSGYRYISGKGSVKLPSGKVFGFPPVPRTR